MDQNLVLLTLEYSYLFRSSSSPYFQTNAGLWKKYTSYDTSSKSSLNSNLQIIDNLGPIDKTIDEISQTEENYISSVKPQMNNQLITVSINGSKSFANDCRIKILQSYNQVNYKQIRLSTSEFGKLHRDPSNFLATLKRFSEKYQVEILIDNNDTDFKGTKRETANHSIYILGNQDNITVSDSQVRILIDRVLNGYHMDSVDIDLSLIPIIGGAELFNFGQVAKQLGSNVYIPDLLPELFNSKLLDNNKSLKIWMSAKEIHQILVTKSILTNLINEVLTEKQNNLIFKEIDLTKVKIDLITLFDQSNALGIMFKYGTFIQLPSLGEVNNYKVMVQGQTIESVNESIHELTLLSSNYYTINISFNNEFNSDLEYYLLNLMHLKKSSIVTYNQYGIEINGSNQEIKQILANLNSNYYFWGNVLGDFSIKLRIEISNDQKDFISGKKNGKVIKILNQLNSLAMVKYNPFNEYNFFIDLTLVRDNDMVINNLIKGIELIELELPAELKCNVPEVFHKSIIGNGGSIIQSIMKKYNVFIKFSSNFNSKQGRIFYSFKRNSNVLIKCPNKNSRNIGLVKQEIDQLVKSCCLNNRPVTNGGTVYNTTKFELWRSHYLLIINQNYNLNFVNSLEIETNTFIDFPESIEDFEDKEKLVISIKGSDAKSKLCAMKLSQMLPQNYQFKIPYCPGIFNNTISDSNKEFQEKIVVPFKLLLGVELSTHRTPDSHHAIVLSSYSDHNINIAINDMTLYLREKKFLISDKQELVFNPVIDVAPPTTKLKPITNQAHLANSKKNTHHVLPLQQKLHQMHHNFGLNENNTYVHYIG